MNKRMLGIGLLLLILTNAVVLARVAYNRSEVTETLTLTEREFRKGYRSIRENSAEMLRLKWRTPKVDKYDYRKLRVTKGQLDALGFYGPPSCKEGQYNRDRKEKEVWVLIELGGEAYRQELERVKTELKEVEQKPIDQEKERQIKSLSNELENLKSRDSRLYAVNISLDKEILVNAINDQNNQFVTKGIVAENYDCTNDVIIQNLFISRLHLPKESLPSNGQWPNKYQVTVAVGRSGEAWVKAVTAR